MVNDVHADVWQHVDSEWYEIIVLVSTSRTIWRASRSMKRVLPSRKTLNAKEKELVC